MKMSAGLDEGDSIAQLPITLDPTVTTLKLIDLFIEKGPQFTVDTLKKYHQGGLKTSPQDNSKATFTYKITKEQ